MQRTGGQGRNKRDGAETEIGAGRHQKLCTAIRVAVTTTLWRRPRRRQVKSAAPKLDVTLPRRTGTSENVSRPPYTDSVVTPTQRQKQALWNVPPCGLVHCADVSKKLAASIIRLGGGLKHRYHKLAQTSSCPSRPSCQHLHCHLLLWAVSTAQRSAGLYLGQRGGKAGPGGRVGGKICSR